MSDLVDTTEMYLRIVYELEEDGVVPLRARIAERLNHSGPTVSQTVARMERDGLILVMGDRHLELTGPGRARAVSVMRKHRLAERFLTDVIGLEWELVHAEACRWEHVMSDAVEHKLVTLLGDPQESPYGNPIPGPDAASANLPVGLVPPRRSALDGLVTLGEIALDGGGAVVVRRIGEHLQEDDEVLRELLAAGVLPGRKVQVGQVQQAGDPVGVVVDGVSSVLSPVLAAQVLVAP